MPLCQQSPHPANYTALVLDRPREEYISWILNAATYGGELEIVILAQFKQVDICIVSYENLSVSEAVLLRYPSSTDASNPNRTIYILYSGQHYDAIVLPMPPCESNANVDVDVDCCSHETQKIFPRDSRYDDMAQTLGTNFLVNKLKVSYLLCTVLISFAL